MIPITQTPSVILDPKREINNLREMFPTPESLIDFLILKEPSDIAIVFRSVKEKKLNFKILTNKIVELMTNYVLYRIQLDSIKELIRLHFPNEDSKIIDTSFKKITEQFAPIFQKLIQKVSPLEHDNYLLAYFTKIDKLINFLSTKDIVSIQKIFKSDGEIEKFLNSIEKLINNYEELNLNQWNCCYELIKVIFSTKDIIKLEAFNKKIEKKLYTDILSRYSSPKNAEALSIATIESIKILFDKLIKENTKSKNSKYDKINFLKQIILLNEQESSFSKYLKSYCSFLSKKRKYIQVVKPEAKMIQGKLSYPISSELIELFKSSPYFNLVAKKQTTYIALKSEDNNLIPKLKLFCKNHPETEKLIKKFIALIKRNYSHMDRTTSFFEKIKYQRESFHKNYFPLLYNNHDKLNKSITRLEKNFKDVNSIEEELKFTEHFKEDLTYRRTHYKNIQSLFSSLAKIELEIATNATTDPTKNKEQIKNLMKLRQKFYNEFPASFYTNLDKYDAFINQDPNIRYHLLNNKMKDKDGKPALCTTIAMECNLMYSLSQFLKQFSTSEKNYREMEKSASIDSIISLQKIFLEHIQPFKDNHEFICSFLPTFLVKKNIERFGKLKSDLSDFTLSRVIERFREIDFLYQKNCYPQGLLFCKITSAPNFPGAFSPEHNHSLSPVKIFPVEEILRAEIQEKEPKEKKRIESKIENPEALATKSSKKRKIKALHKAHKLLEKKTEQLKSIETSAKKKSTSQYFNTLSQAVKVTALGKTELLPQSSLSLLYPQKKQLDYLSSEFHPVSQLPGTPPSWHSTHRRQRRWIDATLPLCPDTFPEYPDRGDNQAIQLFYHTIPKIAHRFIETLGAKQKITQISSDEHTPRRKTVYTAIAKLSTIQQNADNSYSSVGTPIEGFYGIGISKGVLFHDAFSTQAPSERLATSNRIVAPKRFEDENFCVDVYENDEKTYKVSIDDKILMKRLEIFRTKYIHNVK